MEGVHILLERLRKELLKFVHHVANPLCQWRGNASLVTLPRLPKGLRYANEPATIT